MPPDDDNHTKNNTAPKDSKGVRQLVNENAEIQPNRQSFNVKTDADLQKLWNQISAEGKAIETGDASLIARRLPDGTRVQLRTNSATGGRTIDVKPANTNTT